MRSVILEVMRLAVVMACAVLGGSGAAQADELTLAPTGLQLDQAWPAPPRHDLQLDSQIVDRMVELGNRAAEHIEVASRESVGLRIDGRHQRAHLRLMAGKARYLTLQMDEDIHVQDGVARVRSRVDLDIRGYNLHVDIPDVEVLQDAYQDSHYVEVRVPLYERRW